MEQATSNPPAKRQEEDILVRAMSGYMGCCDCDGNKKAFQECGMEISRLRHEVERMRLTKAEREAVALAEDELKDVSPAGARYAATLRGLLERFK